MDNICIGADRCENVLHIFGLYKEENIHYHWEIKGESYSNHRAQNTCCVTLLHWNSITLLALNVYQIVKRWLLCESQEDRYATSLVHSPHELASSTISGDFLKQWPANMQVYHGPRARISPKGHRVGTKSWFACSLFELRTNQGASVPPCSFVT